MSFFTKHESTELIPKMGTTKETLGSRISEQRKKSGLTQEEFAEKLGVTAQAVSKWENDVSCPDIMLLPKIAGIFNVSIDELMGVKPYEKEEPKVNFQQEIPEFKAIPESKKQNLKLRIQIIDRKNNKRPINIAVPMGIVSMITGTGLKISSLVGGIPGNIPIDKIMEQVNNGVSGEIFNMTADDGTEIKIEIS